MKIKFSDNAKDQLLDLQGKPDKSRILKSVLKTLYLMEADLRHPSLQTHIYHSVRGPLGEKVFEAYVQNKIPGAYRIFWYYGPEKNEITILAIIPHP